MNRDDVTRLEQESELVYRLIREAGFEPDCASLQWHERMQNFYFLAIAAEREACWKVCDEIYRSGRKHGAQDCAAAIRARGQA